jgi:hypothetical protein
MPGPADYVSPLLAVPPVSGASILQGQQIGQSLLDARTTGLQQQALQQQTQQQAQAHQFAVDDRAAAIKQAAVQKAVSAARQAQLQADRAALGPNPSAEALRNLVTSYPELADPFKDVIKGKSEAERQSTTKQMAEVLSAVESGSPDVAVDILEADAAAFRNTPGMEREAAGRERLAKLIRENPDAARQALWINLSAVAPKETLDEIVNLGTRDAVKAAKEAEASKIAQEARFATEKQLADIGYTKAQTNRLYAQTKNDAARLGLDRERLASETAAKLVELAQKGQDLPPGIAKERDDAGAASVTASMSATKAEALAQKFDKFAKDNTFSGVAGKARESVARGLGVDNDLTAARRAYDQLKNSAVVASLPPGAASDRDIAMMEAGFPESTASPAEVAEFLRSLARVQRVESRMKNFEADYVAQNRGRGAIRDGVSTIGGVDVLPGMTYGEAAEAYALTLAKQGGG